MLKLSIFLFFTIFSMSSSWKLSGNNLLCRAKGGLKTLERALSTPSTKKVIAVFGTVLSLTTLGPSIPAHAANYGGFGSSYSEVVNPKNAILNDETKDSEEVKSGREGIDSLLKIVATIADDLKKDSQIELQERIKKDLGISRVREVLNKYNGAFTEDTQRGTDRLIRNIIQYLTELDREGYIKSGKQRSDIKATAALKTLTALEGALNELAAFYPK